MSDSRLWDVEIRVGDSDLWILIAEGITYADVIRKYGTECELRLWTAE